MAVGMSKKRAARLVFLYVAVSLLLLFMLSPLLSHIASSHHCIGDNCLYCKQMTDIRKLVKELSGSVLCFAVAIAVLMSFSTRSIRSLSKILVGPSPILQKVKLLN